MIFPADDHSADTENHNPAGNAHTPEGAIDGYHTAQFNGNLFAFDNQRAADQRRMGDAVSGGADTLCFRHQIEGVRIPVAGGLFYIGGELFTRVPQAQVYPEL